MNKRGISPLIAGVMLIGMVVFVSSVVFLWGSDILNLITETTGEKSLKDVDIMQNYNFDVVGAEYSGETVKLNVVNKGKNIEGFIVSLTVEEGSYSSDVNFEVGAGEAKAVCGHYEGGAVDTVYVVPLIDVNGESEAAGSLGKEVKVSESGEEIVCDSNENEIDEIYIEGLGGEGEGNWVEVEIIDQRAVYYYEGHPSHYLHWPQYIDQEVWYVDASTREKIEKITNPISEGEGDFKVIKCINDGSYEGCEMDTSVACSGLIKDYGDIEESAHIYDDSYKDCVSGNPRVGYFREPYNQQGLMRLRYQNMNSGDYGKYSVCVRYKHDSGLESGEKCIESIAEWIDMNRPAGGDYNFGDPLSFSAEPRTRYDNKDVIGGFLEKTCALQPWGWFHNPRNDNGPSITLRRYVSSNNYWGYLGVFTGINSGQPQGDHAIITEIKFPESCYLRDRDGNSNSAFYHHNCGWYHYVDGQDKTVYCCSSWSDTDTGNCDEFVVNGQYGGTLTITSHVDAKGDNYDDMRVYAECPGGGALGSTNEKYEVRVSEANYFWVNDMDYSNEMMFSEAFPDGSYETNTDDFTCSFDLNLCGKTKAYITLLEYREVYGIAYSSPNYVCVSGPECPNAVC